MTILSLQGAVCDPALSAAAVNVQETSVDAGNETK